MAKRWAMSLQAVVAALGGKGKLARCPVHEDRAPSLSLGTGRDGLALVTCHAGCDRRDVLAELERRGLIVREGVDALAPAAAPAAAVPADQGKQAAKATALWWRAQPIEPGSVAARYFQARACQLPLPGADLRTLPTRCGERAPLLVARITAATDARPLTLQFWPVAPNGSRGDRRLMKGLSKAGGVVRLAADDEVTDTLTIAEGCETALSCPGPAWATVDAGNLAAFPVLDGIETLRIAVDDDRAGRAAAEQCAERWTRAGRDVRLVMPGVAAWGVT